MNIQDTAAKESNIPMRRMRTTRGIVDYLKEKDPKTAITHHFIRQLIINGEIDVIHAGSKKLVAIEDIDDYFARPARETVIESQNEHNSRYDSV